MVLPAIIVSPWLGVASVLTEILSYATPILSKAAGKGLEGAAGEAGKSLVNRLFQKRSLSPKTLVQLHTHFAALQLVTTALAAETHAGELSEKYHQLRSDWLARYAPAHVVLHNLDPDTLSSIGIYSRKLSSLLGQPLTVSEQTLSKALDAELTEIRYETSAHLCTLCLQLVRNWSDAKTMAGGLNELSVTLTDTLNGLDCFIKSNWTFKELN